MKARFIFNPRSGHNAKNPFLLDRARTFVREQAWDASVVLTERPRHATELARAAVNDGCTLVVAIGGDGTLNEVAAGLVGTPATLGLIPCGSGNGLGRHLGIPNPGRGAFRTLLDGRPRLIDTGTVNGLPFFNAMGLGFDADISAKFNQLSRRGLASYVVTACRLFFTYRPQQCTIRQGTSEVLHTDAFLVAVANSDQYGNDCYIAPGAAIDDGQLDLTVIQQVGLVSALPLAVRLFAGRIGGSKRVRRLRGDRFVIERSGPGLVHTDGEIHHTEAVLDVRVVPRSLRVLVPAARAA
ncbi:MAG: diacylglycerol kinase family protein [Opitutaceae bacterium]